MTAEKDLAENRSGDEAGAFHGGAKSFLIRRRVKPRADVNGDEELMILIVRCASHSENNSICSSFLFFFFDK